MTWEEQIDGGAAGGTAALATGNGRGWVEAVTPGNVGVETSISAGEHSLSWGGIDRTLIPRPEKKPGEVKAKLAREYGFEERPPQFSTAYVQRREGLFVERLSGVHGVIMNLPQPGEGNTVPPDIYANQVWLRNPPSEWSSQLRREV